MIRLPHYRFLELVADTCHQEVVDPCVHTYVYVCKCVYTYFFFTCLYYTLLRFFSLVVWAALRFVLRGRRGTFEHKLVLGP